MSSPTITVQMMTEREFGFIKLYNSYVTHTHTHTGYIQSWWFQFVIPLAFGQIYKREEGGVPLAFGQIYERGGGGALLLNLISCSKIRSNYTKITISSTVCTGLLFLINKHKSITISLSSVYYPVRIAMLFIVNT